ncbi:MAG: pyrroline-5-carboxylate reductase [Aquificae bacterium]|nr:pyrroline-5-carboxylate reductase [Aquificota bacterium]
MKVGFWGFGNMGRAVARGLERAGVGRENFIVSVKSKTSKEKLLKEGYSVLPLEGVALASDVLFLAVKPKDLFEVAKAAAPYARGKLLVSLLAGTDLETLKRAFPQAKVVRTMPNLAVSVGKGLWGVTFSPDLSEEEKRKVVDLLSKTGKVFELEESLMDAFTALAGSGPAFAAELLDALAQGGVKLGFKYQTALEAVLALFEGTVALLKEEGLHPALLRDRVSSPAGTTVYGLSVLYSKAVKGALMEALEAAAKRAKELKKG